MWVFWFILLEVHLFLDVYIHILPQIWDVFLHWISLGIFFFFSLQQLYFSAPKFLFFLNTYYQKKKKKNKAKQFAVSFIVSSILLRQLLKISFGSFVYQFEHLFQTNLFLVPMGSTGGPDSNESTCNVGDLGLIPGLKRFPGGEHGNPLQYSCLENPHGHRVAKSWT